ncbi:class I SAM-dependent methyltransferase [Sphaerotilus mobilis]|uniref:23S rRNA (Cytosine1962-C5)-methyltransferase n=1 Tax=Sphaerotilus mobilis TaxID=47994 RepID=A0A4Q7LWE3_9BURK|nr:class I SAM-dependent methyltransferase [Sphaerotilus mobilis]RZS58772.1 23S rRNA (cytosine1962-C5)-methyltransferase [Sphaerotilus mobilis]
MQALLDTLATMALPTDATRVFHGRGGRHPGCEHWTLDAYPPVLVLTSFQPVDETELAVIGEALARRWVQIAPDGAGLNWVFQQRQPGGRVETRLMAGAVPEPHVVHEDGAAYQVHVLKGQNHGLFLDMAGGRRWVRAHVAQWPGMKVLNLFAYTCAFSVVAMQAGARAVVNLDMADGALAIGRRNHALNGLPASAAAGVSFLAHDLFSSWGKVGRAGPYDLVIVDPPSFQKGSFVATKDYARLMRRLPDLLAPEGHVLLCLNAPELGLAFLRDAMAELAPTLRFVERVANPDTFEDVSTERALKVLVYAAP